MTQTQLIVKSPYSASVMVGHIDMVGAAMAKFNIVMNNNQMLSNFVSSCALEMKKPNCPVKDELHASLLELAESMTALQSMIVCLAKLRKDMAKENGIGNTAQYLTPEYTALMLIEEMDFDNEKKEETTGYDDDDAGADDEY